MRSNLRGLAGRAENLHLLRSAPLRKEFSLHAQHNPAFVNLSGYVVDLPVPAKVTQAIEHSIRTEGYVFSPVRGTVPLRRAIAENYATETGINLDWETQVLVTLGPMHGLFMAILALIESGDQVIVKRPGLPYDEIVSFAGGSAVFVDMEPAAFELPLKAIAEAVTERTKLMVLTNPHNPTGRVFEYAELEEFASIARRHNLYVLSDEVFDKYVFDGRKHISMATLPGMQERTLVVNGVTKSYAMPGARIGWVTGPASILAALEPMIFWNMQCVPLMLQQGAEAAIRDDTDWVERNRRELQTRRDALFDGLHTNPHLDVKTTEGSFLCFAPIAKTGMSSLEFARCLMHRANVGVSPGVAYHGEDFVRISLAAPAEKLYWAGTRIAEFLGQSTL